MKRKEVVEKLISKMERTPLWDSNAEENITTKSIDDKVSKIVDKLKFNYSECQTIINNTPSWSKTHFEVSVVRDRIFETAAVKLINLVEYTDNIESYDQMVNYLNVSDYVKAETDEEISRFDNVLDVLVGANE